MASSSSTSKNVAVGAAIVGGALVLGVMARALMKEQKKGSASKDSEGKAVVPVKTPEKPPGIPRALSKDAPIRRQNALVVVDPISTGANLCHEIMLRRIPCIRVFSAHVPESLAHMVAGGLLHDFAHTIYDDDADFHKTVQQLHELPYNIQAVIAGSELAIELADKLSERMGCRSNGSETSFLRRDKFQMGEAVRRSHLRAVRQARAHAWHQVETFLHYYDPKPFKIVIKPIRSAGSDHVSLCENKEHLKACMTEIVGHTNKMGMSNYAAVVQEYLEGLEYVVDTVSRDGKHKLAALWVYDKQPANGAKFVYFGMRAVDPNSDVGKRLFEYQKGVLDALGIQHGPGHGEVIDTKTGPCLVECGARPHGAEGTFILLSDECFGRNQVNMTVDCYAESKRFEEYEDTPKMRKHAFKVDLVSFVTGELTGYAHKEEIQAMASFRRFDMLPKEGEFIPLTVDCFTAVGSVTLIHDSEAQINRDIARIRELEKTFFVVKPVTTAPGAGKDKEERKSQVSP